jgi:hypothetical protein
MPIHILSYIQYNMEYQIKVRIPKCQKGLKSMGEKHVREHEKGRKTSNEQDKKLKSTPPKKGGELRCS